MEMAAQILNGKNLAEEIRHKLKEKVARLRSRTGRPPGLATVLVGEDPASEIYVRNKIQACLEIGILPFEHRLPASIP